MTTEFAGAILPLAGNPAGPAGLPRPIASSPPGRPETPEGGAVRRASPAGPETRLQIRLDEASGRVVGRYVDVRTGRVVGQVPSEEMLRLLARAREHISRLLDQRI